LLQRRQRRHQHQCRCRGELLVDEQRRQSEKACLSADFFGRLGCLGGALRKSPVR
jgi:hypothetical protein